MQPICIADHSISPLQVFGAAARILFPTTRVRILQQGNLPPVAARGKNVRGPRGRPSHPCTRLGIPPFPHGGGTFPIDLRNTHQQLQSGKPTPT